MSVTLPSVKNERFEDVDAVQPERTLQLKAITEEQFQKVFEDLRQRCISSGGDYFKGI